MAASSSFGGNARPAHVTSLSGKVQGLKFMQRAAAANGPTSPSSSSTTAANARASSSSKADASKGSTTADDAEPQTENRQGAARFVVQDGNDEHWGFAGASSTSAYDHGESADQPAAQGWNTWLLSRAADEDAAKPVTSSRSMYGKAKQRAHTSNDDDVGSVGFNAVPSVGRRTFGKLKASTEGVEDGNDNEQSDHESEEADESRASVRSSSSKKRRRQGSLEPDFDFEGQVRIRAPKSVKKNKDAVQSNARGTGNAQPGQFIKPGTMNQKKSQKDEQQEQRQSDSTSSSDDLDESFADNDNDDGGDSSFTSIKGGRRGAGASPSSGGRDGTAAIPENAGGNSGTKTAKRKRNKKNKKRSGSDGRG